MPRGDRTGPMGVGPMMGRAAGFCAGFGVPGYMNPMPGYRMGGGRGGWGGRGWRHMYYATGLPGWARWGGFHLVPPVTPTAEEEVAVLKRQAEALKAEMEAINQRIEALTRTGESGATG
jgi:hypothetical protein